MSQENNARDPYVGLNRHFSERARSERPEMYTIGKILSLRPLRIRADGLDLDEDDVRVPESMYSNFVADKPIVNRGVRTMLPYKRLTCRCDVGVGFAERTEEFVFGAVCLGVDDEVLLMRSDDGQTYYLIERMVKL